MTVCGSNLKLRFCYVKLYCEAIELFVESALTVINGICTNTVQHENSIETSIDRNCD
jgi:hypothetical protein